MRCEPANMIINRLGGLARVAAWCGLNISTVLRWRTPRSRGGTGGTIPVKYAPRLMQLANESEVALSADDFLGIESELKRRIQPEQVSA
jgi:hypothetical protein